MEGVADQVHEHDVDHSDQQDEERNGDDQRSEDPVAPQDREPPRAGLRPSVVEVRSGTRRVRTSAGGDGHDQKRGGVDCERHARAERAGQ